MKRKFGTTRSTRIANSVIMRYAVPQDLAKRTHRWRRRKRGGKTFGMKISYSDLGALKAIARCAGQHFTVKGLVRSAILKILDDYSERFGIKPWEFQHLTPEECEGIQLQCSGANFKFVLRVHEN